MKFTNFFLKNLLYNYRKYINKKKTISKQVSIDFSDYDTIQSRSTSYRKSKLGGSR